MRRGSKTTLLLAAAALVLLAPAGGLAQLYRYTDDNGETHFVQGPDAVPPRYRSRGEMIGAVDAPPPPAPASAAASDGKARLKFTPGKGIVVPVTINGRKTIQLLLDTGADRTRIKSAALLGSGVSYGSAVRSWARGVGGDATGLLVTLDSLEVGGVRVAGLKVDADDANFIPIADGVLGRDFLDRFKVTIDNQRGIVEIASR